MEGPAGQSKAGADECTIYSTGDNCSKAQNIGQTAGLTVAGIHQGGG